MLFVSCILVVLAVAHIPFAFFQATEYFSAAIKTAGKGVCPLATSA